MEGTDDLEHLPAGRRRKKHVVAWLARRLPAVYIAYMRLVYATSRIDDSALEVLRERKRTHQATLLLLLHQDVFVAPYFLRGLQVCGLANVGDAGDFIAFAMDALGHSSVRGGSSSRDSRRRTLSAVRELVRFGRSRAEEGFVISITPDGSRGPAGACKAGFAFVALETGAAIYCMKIQAAPAWFLPTWDRTMVPLPFGRLWAEVSQAIVVEPGARAADLELVRARAEEELHRVHALAFARAGRRAVPELQRL
ncbi:MAG TPA: DUF374 domain-containing protein [Candidatus Limnocylindrales bacterium]|nr:DUF374 domain-containing protein [Candidatus Limnocylindrales bacterium]